MRGAIRDGERVRLVEPGDLSVGQVAMAVLPDDTLVIHRVRRVDDGVVFLRGDSCRRSDPPVAADQIVAVVEPTPPPTRLAALYSLIAQVP